MFLQKSRLWVLTPSSCFENPCLCVNSVTFMMWEALKCFFSFPFFSSALSVGDNKYLWTSNSILMLSQHCKWHQFEPCFKINWFNRKGSYRAVSMSSPCQTAAWCCQGDAAFSSEYHGLFERIEIVSGFCLGLDRMYFPSLLESKLPLACLPNNFIFLF